MLFDPLFPRAPQESRKTNISGVRLKHSVATHFLIFMLDLL